MRLLAAHLEGARPQLAALAHGALKLERDGGALRRGRGSGSRAREQGWGGGLGWRAGGQGWGAGLGGTGLHHAYAHHPQPLPRRHKGCQDPHPPQLLTSSPRRSAETAEKRVVTIERPSTATSTSPSQMRPHASPGAPRIRRVTRKPAPAVSPSSGSCSWIPKPTCVPSAVAAAAAAVRGAAPSSVALTAATGPEVAEPVEPALSVGGWSYARSSYPSPEYV